MINKIFRIGLGISIGAVLMLAPSIAQAADNTPNINVYALDTIANFETVIKTSGLEPFQSFYFTVRKPDNGMLKLRALSGEKGLASVSIDDSETKQAGIYEVDVLGARTNFQVFPGEMNSAKSEINVNKQYVSANGSDFAQVKVKIADEFGNPLEFHEVRLTSSRATDAILAQEPETNENGIATFVVASPLAGISFLKAVDESIGVELKQTVKLTFTSATSVLKAVGGDPETVLLAQANPLVIKFILEQLPSTVEKGKVISVKIRATDSVDNVVPSYTGTVIFSATDVNATLPNPYTFKSSDQGQKTFDLALSFGTIGSQTLTVQEQGNALIKGTAVVTVTTQSGGSGTSNVKITKPAPGTYTTNTFSIEGEVLPNAGVKLFDNGQQIAEVKAGTDARFSYITPLLKDGIHNLQAESNGVKSSMVAVTIDTTPAEIQSFSLGDTELAPGETTTITIKSDPDLSSAQVIVGDFITDLKQDTKNLGTYTGVITAPQKAGKYPVTVILTDKLGNPTPEAEIGKIEVKVNLGVNPSPSFTVPGKVQNVKAFPGNGKVTLTWSAAQAESGIASYRVYYGTNAGNLNLVAATKDSNTSWYVVGLQNGKEYFFRLAGVDTNGNESDSLSDVVSATPSATATDVILPGGGGLPGGSGNDNGSGDGGTPLVLCNPMPCPPDIPTAPYTPQDGPEIFGILAASFFGGAIIRFVKKIRSAKS